MKALATILNHNKLVKILDQYKLTKENYVIWKKNIHIVLDAEEVDYILTDPYQIKPSEGASDKEIEAYEVWKADNEYAKCIILSSIEDEFQEQHT